MDHIVAFTALIIGTGLIAKVFPRIMTKIFDRYPEHFSPTHKFGSGDEIPAETCDRCGGAIAPARRARCAQCGWIRDC